MAIMMGWACQIQHVNISAIPLEWCIYHSPIRSHQCWDKNGLGKAILTSNTTALNTDKLKVYALDSQNGDWQLLMPARIVVEASWLCNAQARTQ